MKLALIGVNFKTAPVAVRERLAASAAQLPARLDALGERLPGSERVLLSTCNRTEFYLAGACVPDDLQALVGALDPAGETGVPLDAWYHLRGGEAVAHLMEVASSLDSMVVGETEVLGQVKQAYLAAGSHGAVGPTLHAVFQGALRVAKRVHTETDLCRGRVSVSSIAVDFAERVFEDLRAKTVLIVGAGDVAEQALRSLVERGAPEVLVFNRSPERAAALAAAHGGRAIPFELLADYLERADVIMSSTGAQQPILMEADVARASRARRGRPMLLIDLSMPRNIDPAASKIDNVYLYHLDDLQRVAEENLAVRRESMDKARQLVREGVQELAASCRPAVLGSLLRQFDEHANAIRDQAVRRCLARPHMAELPPAVRDEITNAVDGVLRKMLAAPRESMKAASHNGGWDEYARVVRDLFRFPDPPAPPPSTPKGDA
jgi:glutamyl-tRNA reductase